MKTVIIKQCKTCSEDFEDDSVTKQKKYCSNVCRYILAEENYAVRTPEEEEIVRYQTYGFSLSYLLEYGLIKPLTKPLRNNLL